MESYFLVLGSNTSYPLSRLAEAVERISSWGHVGPLSPAYLTEPVDYPYQPAFLNMAIMYRTDLTPVELIGIIKKVEKKMGRFFSESKGPRRIDIDVAAGSMEVNDTSITIPHPALTVRKFMLQPLCDIESEFIVPSLGKTFGELLKECPDNSFLRKL